MVFNIDALVGPTERNNDERKRLNSEEELTKFFSKTTE
jgi:hypothetical protein